MKITELGLGRNRIDLAHVSALVLLLDVGDMQKPGFVLVVLIVRHADPGIPGDDVVVHGQDGRLLEVHPCDLEEKKENNMCNNMGNLTTWII